MNLKVEQRRYKVFLDDSYALETEPGKTEEIWRYYELRGQYGTIYAYSPSLLGVLVTSPTIAHHRQPRAPGKELEHPTGGG